MTEQTILITRKADGELVKEAGPFTETVALQYVEDATGLDAEGKEKDPDDHRARYRNNKYAFELKAVV